MARYRQWAIIEIKTQFFGLLYTAFELAKWHVLFGVISLYYNCIQR
jgi:hypothetical protein